MNETNQMAEALGFRKAKGMILAIKEHGITPKWTTAKAESLAEKLAKAKDADEWKSKIDGQLWYVNMLVEASKLTPTELLASETEKAFPDVADHDEKVAALEAL